MRYRRRKLDANQAEIAAALRAVGATVVDLSAVGGGVPDLLVGRYGETFLIEVKAPDARVSGRTMKATAARQQEFREGWRGGRVFVVRSVDEALAAVGVILPG